MKLFFPCLNIIMPGKYQMDIVSFDEEYLEIDLESQHNYGEWFADDTLWLIKDIVKNKQKQLDELDKIYNSPKNSKDRFQKRYDEQLNLLFKNYAPQHPKLLTDRTFRNYISKWAMLFYKNPEIGDMLWFSREQYYCIVKSLHTMDYKTKITYLLNETLQSVSRLWEYNNNRFEEIDGLNLDDSSYKSYQEMEISLSSINSNINKMISIVVKEKEFKSYETLLGEDYGELLEEVNSTTFYLESYHKMIENLVTQIHTESHIDEISTSNEMNQTLERFTFVSILMLIPMFITSFFGMNIFYYGEYGTPYWEIIGFFGLCAVIWFMYNYAIKYIK